MQFHMLPSEETAVKRENMKIQQIKQFEGAYKNLYDL